MLLFRVNFGKNNTHIQHVLGQAGIFTTEALEAAHDSELLRLCNFGKKGLADARKVVPFVNWNVWTPEMQEAEIQRERGPVTDGQGVRD
jgi:hypothetical protein